MKVSLWRAAKPLVLASTSRIRRSLLESAGLSCETEASLVDERAVEATATAATLAPAALAARLATEKALAVSRRRPGAIVVGADQVLDLDGEVLHKPANRAEALATLLRLQGRRHRLHSAVAVAEAAEVVDGFVDGATLGLRVLSPEAIETYLDLAGPSVLESVGAYQVEALGVHLFDAIEGEHSAILGLPLRPLLSRFRARGWLAF